MSLNGAKPIEALSCVRPDRSVRRAAVPTCRERALTAHSHPAAGPADPVLDPQEMNIRPVPKRKSLSQNHPGFFLLNCVTRQENEVDGLKYCCLSCLIVAHDDVEMLVEIHLE